MPYAEEFALANDYAAFVESPHDRARSWPKTPRSRTIASYGLARYAQSQPAAPNARSRGGRARIRAARRGNRPGQPVRGVGRPEEKISAIMSR
jgi:hypothetical protein